ncbi:hypothetical protein [Burkholderia multivorans]|uniref:hypothetical protein n=1 Tax=Burkholderia multivorans TaxID=87883 RepID=UPI00123918DA|nr:hypothetical protein [Burkholderia multivorans]MBU9247804.1 hypothetical protein [Burkholderia multivorans]QET31710.1 hypothetical protein FOB31_18845 [Burkholderia multivorans]QET40870.1 hypothetical protein FOB30_25015 [Burkholderia multivorans]
MARPARPEQLAALTRIRECMAEHGEEVGARVARADFAKIDKGTWSRWCRQVREENVRFAESEGAAEREPVTRVSVASASASEVVEPGRIDFFGELNAMLADCDMLRRYAAPVDPQTGLRKPRNPMMLAQAIKLRVSVMGLAQRHAEGALMTDSYTRQMKAMLEILGTALKNKGDKEMTRAVLTEIHELHAEYRARDRYLGREEAAA